MKPSILRVLVISPYPETVTPVLKLNGDDFTAFEGPLPVPPNRIDFIVCYGSRHIIREPILSEFKDRIINLHISMLPWNRGADPNFWSWFDATPKGVSIHQIDAGIDTGPVIAQQEVDFTHFPDETLATSYHRLRCTVEILFGKFWPAIRTGTATAREQKPGGSYHRTSDKETIFGGLPLGYDTPVRKIEAIGTRQREGANAIVER